MDPEQLPTEAYELGELVAEYDAAGKPAENALTWLLPSITVLAGLALLWGYGQVITGVIVLTLGLIMAIRATRGSSGIRAVHVFTGGLFNTTTRQNDVVKWDDITAAKMRMTVYRHGGVIFLTGPIVAAGTGNAPTLSCNLQLSSGQRLKYSFPYEEALELSQHIHDNLASRGFSSSLKREWDPRQINYYWEYTRQEMALQDERAPSPNELIEMLRKQPSQSDASAEGNGKHPEN